MKKLIIIGLMVLTMINIASASFIDAGAENNSFVLTQEDSNLYANVTRINATTYNIVVDAKVNLPGSYRASLAICDTGVVSAKVNGVELGGVTFSNGWCPENSFEGFEMAGNIGKGQLPLSGELTVNLDQGMDQIIFYYGDGTGIIEIDTSAIKGTAIVYDSFVNLSSGMYVLCYEGANDDLYVANSSDNGQTWDTTLVYTGTISDCTLTAFSNDLVMIATNPTNDIVLINRTPSGSFTTPVTFWDGDAQNRFTDIEMATDSSDTVHFGLLMGEVNNSLNNDFTYYWNWSKTGGKYSETFKTTTLTFYGRELFVNEANDTDFMDLVVGEDDIVYVVVNGETDNIRIKTSESDFTLDKVTGTGSNYNQPKIDVFSDGHVFISIDDLGEYDVLNSTVWNSGYDLFTKSDSTAGVQFTQVINDEQVILYGYTSSNMSVINNSGETGVWTELLPQELRDASITYVLGSRHHYPVTARTTHTLAFPFINNTGLYYAQIEFPVTITATDTNCTYDGTSSLWTVDCSELCVFNQTFDLLGNKVRISGSGSAFGVRNITNYNTLTISDSCQVKA